MKRVYVATHVRGFLKKLFNSIENTYFEFDDKKIYETNSSIKMILHRIAKSKIISYLGIVPVIKVENNNFDIVFSYNRFIKAKTPYVIYLENPLALVNYSTLKSKSKLGKKNVDRLLNDPNLYAIVGLSKACIDTLPTIYNIPNNVKLKQIYPLIPNVNCSVDNIKVKSNLKEIKCTYISSKFELKGGADILQAFEKLKQNELDNIKLKVITSFDSISQKYWNIIKANPNIEVSKFNFSKDELNNVYRDTNILLNPSRMDSFGMVLLEAMKFGVTIISTDLYAIPELVKDDVNGFLSEPKYRFFQKNNLPNEYVWNNREKTIYSDYVDESMVEFIYSKLTLLNESREKLSDTSYNSYIRANNGEFSDNYIINEWEELFNSIKGNRN